MIKNVSLIDSYLLNSEALSRPLQIFLCGPGYDAASHTLREKLKFDLEKYPRVTATFGEEINAKTVIPKGSDLQTIEARFAHLTDFTALILNSPGSIAELGTFSMMKNLRSRLVVFVPMQFYESDSYIARGPLSVIASEFPSNIIYYTHDESGDLASRLNVPICMYKYISFLEGWRYSNNISHQSWKIDFSYENYIAPYRSSFEEAVSLVAINILDQPTFADLAGNLAFTPNQINSALKRLHNAGKIKKEKGSYYVGTKGYGDPLLKGFSTTQISKRRSKISSAA